MEETKEKRIFIETLPSSKQIVQRELARYSKYDFYFQDIAEAGIFKELIPYFKYLDVPDDQNQLKKLFGDNWKAELLYAQQYCEIVGDAQSTILLEKDRKYERNFDNKNYISLVNNIIKINKVKIENGVPDTLRLKFKRFVMTLLSHTDVGQRSIPDTAYYDAQYGNLHLSYDRFDNIGNKDREKQIRLQKEMSRM